MVLTDIHDFAINPNLCRHIYVFPQLRFQNDPLLEKCHNDSVFNTESVPSNISYKSFKT